MKRFLIFTLGLWTLIAAALAEDVAVMKLRVEGEKEVTTIVMELYEESAPRTVENFKKLARKGFYKGTEIHRAFPGMLLQMGDPLSRGRDKSEVGTGGPGYTLPAEINRKNTAGSVVMGRLPDPINPARRSSGSQFFINLEPMPGYDGKYTVFGQVIDGLEKLDAISRAPTDSNDYLVKPVEIRSIRIVPREKAGV